MSDIAHGSTLTELNQNIKRKLKKKPFLKECDHYLYEFNGRTLSSTLSECSFKRENIAKKMLKKINHKTGRH